MALSDVFGWMQNMKGALLGLNGKTTRSPYQRTASKSRGKSVPGAFGGKMGYELHMEPFRRDMMGKPRSWKKALAEGRTW